MNNTTTTPPDTRAAINQRLAAAMGWQYRLQHVHSSGATRYTSDESFTLEDAQRQCEGLNALERLPTKRGADLGWTWRVTPAPDFFTDAEASRALVEWLAGQEREIQSAFIGRLSRVLLQLRGEEGVSVIDWMAAPLPAIALAAAAVLEEME